MSNELTDLQDKRLDRLADLIGQLPAERQEQLMSELQDKHTFSTEEAADITGYHAETIRRHIRGGKLTAAKTGGRGGYRIARPELARWWRETLGGGQLFDDDGGADD